MRPLFLERRDGQRGSRRALTVVLVVMLLALFAYGAWLDAGGQELQAQAALQEHAVWLGGYWQGRQDAQLVLHEQTAAAYEAGMLAGAQHCQERQLQSLARRARP